MLEPRIVATSVSRFVVADRPGSAAGDAVDPVIGPGPGPGASVVGVRCPDLRRATAIRHPGRGRLRSLIGMARGGVGKRGVVRHSRLTCYAGRGATAGSSSRL